MVEFSPNRYETMQYKRCGKWGLKLPRISLGAWETFGGYRGEETARECLYRAFDLGITHFDLANNYGHPNGNAELVVGRILRTMPRDELIISTKAGYYMWPGPYGDGLSKKYLIASLDQSLKRLGLEYVDIFYLHRPDYETPLEESLGALDLIVRQGKALYVGVSNFPGVHLADSVRIIEKNSWSPIVIHQPRYNLLDRRCEWELFPHTERHGVGVITFSPLASGRLTGKYLEGVPKDSRASLLWGETKTGQLLDKNVIAKVKALNQIAERRGQSLAQMALAWNLRLPAVTSVLIGASKVEQIEENLKALDNLEFSPEEIEEIDRITLNRS